MSEHPCRPALSFAWSALERWDRPRSGEGADIAAVGYHAWLEPEGYRPIHGVLLSVMERKANRNDPCQGMAGNRLLCRTTAGWRCSVERALPSPSARQSSSQAENIADRC